MADVKAAEISAILKQQLSGFESTASLDEVGTVLTVGDGIVRAYGLSNAQGVISPCLGSRAYLCSKSLLVSVSCSSTARSTALWWWS